MNPWHDRRTGRFTTPYGTGGYETTEEHDARAKTAMRDLLVNRGDDANAKEGESGEYAPNWEFVDGPTPTAGDGKGDDAQAGPYVPNWRLIDESKIASDAKPDANTDAKPNAGSDGRQASEEGAKRKKSRSGRRKPKGTSKPGDPSRMVFDFANAGDGARGDGKGLDPMEELRLSYNRWWKRQQRILKRKARTAVAREARKLSYNLFGRELTDAVRGTYRLMRKGKPYVKAIRGYITALIAQKAWEAKGGAGKAPATVRATEYFDDRRVWPRDPDDYKTPEWVMDERERVDRMSAEWDAMEVQARMMAQPDYDPYDPASARATRLIMETRGFKRGKNATTGGIYDPWGYDKDGFDEQGNNKFTHDKYDPWGYDRFGYDKDGYDRRGFDARNRHRDTHDAYDPLGYDARGIDENGWSLHGWNATTGTRWDPEGYDVDGYDKRGYDRDGFDRDGRHEPEVA